MVEAVADVAGDLRVEREDAARRVGGQAQVAAHVAAVPRRLHVLAPRRRPAHGAVEALREHRHDGVFLVHGHLGAEAASHAPRHQVDLLGLELEPLGDLVRACRAGSGCRPTWSASAPWRPRSRCTRGLHRERDHALVDHLDVDDDRGRLEGRVDVALLELERDAEVGAGLRVQERRALAERRLGSTTAGSGS